MATVRSTRSGDTTIFIYEMFDVETARHVVLTYALAAPHSPIFSESQILLTVAICGSDADRRVFVEKTYPWRTAASTLTEEEVARVNYCVCADLAQILKTSGPPRWRLR